MAMGQLFGTGAHQKILAGSFVVSAADGTNIGNPDVHSPTGFKSTQFGHDKPMPTMEIALACVPLLDGPVVITEVRGIMVRAFIHTGWCGTNRRGDKAGGNDRYQQTNEQNGFHSALLLGLK